MVNVTALERITRFINTEPNIKQMKKWSDRFRQDNMQKKSCYLNDLVKKVKQILILISGDDIVEMLKGI